MLGYAPGWQLRCRICGLTFDAADLGVIRIHAVGHSNKLYYCGQCHWPRWFALEPTDVAMPIGPRCDLSTHAAASVR